MKRTTVLLIIVMIGLFVQPVTAQETFATAAAIKDQSALVRESRNLFEEACYGPVDGFVAERLDKWPGTLEEKCERAEGLFQSDVDTLVRLMHGDPLLIICTEGGCPMSVPSAGTATEP